jgi:hypothetical protein
MSLTPVKIGSLMVRENQPVYKEVFPATPFAPATALAMTTVTAFFHRHF